MKQLQEIFKKAAETVRPKGFAGHGYSIFDSGYRQGLQEGMDIMYKALGWREAEEPVPEDGLYKTLFPSGFVGFGLYKKGEIISNINHTITHYVPENPPNPADLTTLEKLLQEQLNKTK